MLKRLLLTLFIAIPLTVSAQVFNQNQIVTTPYLNGGIPYASSSAGNAKFGVISTSTLMTLLGGPFSTGTNFWGGSLGGAIYKLNSGYVGFGTTTPAASLHIYEQNGTGASPSILLSGNTGGDTDFWLARITDDGTDDDDSFRIGRGVIPGTAPFFTITNTGNTGIGTTTPLSLLTVSSSTASGLSRLFGVGTTTDNLFSVFANGQAVLGTPTPTSGAMLTVNASTTANTGVAITGVTTGSAINAAALTSGTGITAPALTSGRGILLGAITSGFGVDIGTTCTTCIGINFGVGSVAASTASAVRWTGSRNITADYTGSFIQVDPTHNIAAAATRTTSGSMLRIVPTYSVSGALASNQIITGSSTYFGRILNNGGTGNASITASGPVVSIFNNRTGAGTTTDTSTVLDVRQSNTTGSGDALIVENLGTGNLAEFIGNGNFGIGTSTPGSKLTVNGTSLLYGAVSLPLLSNGCLTLASGVITSLGVSCLTANQTITLSGDVSGSGSTAITTTIGALKVLNSMIANATIDLTTKVTGVLPIANGGTGTSTAPTIGKVLLGNASGGYDLVATSSLGISGGGSYTATYPITLTGSAFGIAFGTTTSNSWSQPQFFNGGASTTALTVETNVAGSSTIQIGTSHPGCIKTRDASNGAYTYSWTEAGILYTDTVSCQ